MRQRGIFEKMPGSGVWWIRYADATGRIRREKAGTKSAAVTLYRKRKTEVLQGRKLPERLRQRAVTFGEIAHDTLIHSRNHKLSYRDDLSRMGRLLRWFQDRAAESITPEEIEQRLAEVVEEEGWTSATANRHKSLLSLTYKLAIRNKKVSTNPARLVHTWKEDNARIRWLSDEEEERLRFVIARSFPEHMPELDFALNTGLRRSKQFSLTWECVNLERRLAAIERSKNGRLRHIPLNTAALAALGELRRRANGTGPVFRNLRGEPLAGPRHWFEPAVKEARIERFSWHCLRHTFASRLVMAGVDLRTVQELMGHQNIAMTVRYAHLAPAHELAAVERLVHRTWAPQTASPTDTKTDTRVELPTAAALV